MHSSMSRFWAPGAGGGSASDSSDDDDSDNSSKSSNSSDSSSGSGGGKNDRSDDDSSDDDNNAGGGAGDRNAASGENRWLAFSDDEDSSDDDDARVVKSGKERAFEFFQKQTTSLRGAMKARDYYAIQTLFDDLAKAMIKAKAYLKAGVPRFLVRILVDLEDYVTERLKDKEQFKSISARQNRALNKMKLTLKKHNKAFEVVMDAYRQNPDVPDEDDADEDPAVDDEDDDDKDSDSSTTDSERDDKPAQSDSDSDSVSYFAFV